MAYGFEAIGAMTNKESAMGGMSATTPAALHIDEMGQWKVLQCIAPPSKAHVHLISPHGSSADLGPVSGVVRIDEIYSSLLVKHKEEAKYWRLMFAGPALTKGLAYRKFYELVKWRGPWDLKTRHDLIYGTSTYYGTLFEYKGRILRAEDVGNHHYGVMGRYLGIPLSILLRAAGVAQIWSSNSPLRCRAPYYPTDDGFCSDAEFMNRPEKKVRPVYMVEQLLDSRADPSFGDDPIDQHFIRAGYWDN